MSDADISSFCAITGATGEDAVKFLQLSDGNVESAVMLYLEGGLDVNRQEMPPLDESGNAVNGRSQQSQSDFSQGDYYDEVRRPIAPTRETLIGDFGTGNMRELLTGQSGSDSEYEVPNPFGRIALQQQRSGNDSEASSTANRLAQLFSSPTELMFRGSIDEARTIAKSSNKWVMITIHDPTEFPCQVLNRDLWKNSSVSDIVKQSFIFMQYNVTSTEGMKYQNFYHYDGLPHIAIIDAITGERMKQWTGSVNASEFLLDLVDFLDKHSDSQPSPMSITSPNSSQSKNKSSSDLATKSKKQKIDEMTEDEQLAAAIAASQQDSTAIDLTKQSNSPDSIQPSKRRDLTADEQPANIQFRLPDGSRVVQKFSKQDKVIVLFQHLKAVSEDLKSKKFELYFHRDPLSKKIDETVEEAGISGVSLQVDYL